MKWLALLSVLATTLLGAGQDGIPLSDVIALRALPGERSVRLSWGAPLDKRYDHALILDQVGSVVAEVPSGTSTFDVLQLDPATVFTFTVKAVSASGDSSPGRTVSAKPFEYAAATSWPTTPGLGIRYDVADTAFGSESGRYWAVFQQMEPLVGDPYQGGLFACTLTKEATDPSGSWVSGEAYAPYDPLAGPRPTPGRPSPQSVELPNAYFEFNSGCPSSNTANIYMMCSLPAFFNAGDKWDGDDPTMSYSIDHIDRVTIGAATFTDCLRLSMTCRSGEAYLAGTGYFLLARGVGIVEMQFNRNGSPGGSVSYRYAERQVFARRSLSGQVVNNGAPVAGVRVQLAYCNQGVGTTTDADGRFLLTGAYGPIVILRLGYEGHDSLATSLDFDYPEQGYPKKYAVSGTAGDVSGLLIELSRLSHW